MYSYDSLGFYIGVGQPDAAGYTDFPPGADIEGHRWRWVGNTWKLVSLTEKKIITKLEYMSRFTDEELIGIIEASKVYAQIELWYKKFEQAQDIDLNDPRTLSGLLALEGTGLLAAGRANEIVG